MDTEKKYDIRQIIGMLPHRFPFIMIDRILELVPGESVVGLKNVTINEPFFQGHFPDLPVMPGVMIVEALGQAGGILVIDSLPPERHGLPVYFMGFDKVRFRRPVVPGDQLRLEVNMIKERKKAVKMAGVATVDGKKAAEAEFLATFGDM